MTRFGSTRTALLLGLALVTSNAAAQTLADIPLDLHAAVAEALRRSPALRPAQDAIEVAAIREDLAASQFGVKMGPTFTGGMDAFGAAHNQVGFSVAKRLRTGTEVRAGADWTRYGAANAPFTDGGLTVAIAQPLLRGLGPAVTATLRDAERATLSSERRLEAARQDLVLTVAGAYFGAIRQQRLVASGARALDRAVALRRASEARTKVGLATRLDVLRADLLVAESDAHLDRQRELLADTLDRLKLLLGRPLDAAIALADDDIPGAGARGTSDPSALDALVAAALGRRLDLREAHARVGDAERAASVARWNLLPQVDLTATYTRRGLGGSTNLLQDAIGGWRVGVATSYPLERAAESAAAQTATIGTRAARLALADLEQQAAADVRRAWRARERAAAAIEIQRKAVALARQQLRLADLRYQRGVAGNFDVIDAESNLFRAESALITAQADRALAGLALERATGALDPSRYLP
jgi:outer membrane protein TolC